MTEQLPSHRLADLISPTTSYSEFKLRVDELVGDRVIADRDELYEGLLLLSGFAPSPAFFDRRAIEHILDVNPNNLDAFLETACSLGVITNVPPGSEKYQMDPQMSTTLRAIHNSTAQG